MNGQRAQTTEPFLRIFLIYSNSLGRPLLTVESSKLERWVEHFASIKSDYSEASIEDVAVISQSIHPLDSAEHDNLCVPLSKEKISTAISQLGSGQAPGMEGITVEMIMLGGAESVKWLKPLFDIIWHSKKVPDDVKWNQLPLCLVCSLHRHK